VRASLERSGLGCVVLDSVVEDPPEHVVTGLGEGLRAAGCVGVVGLGGGSSMDAAKLAAFLAGPSARVGLASERERRHTGKAAYMPASWAMTGKRAGPALLA